MKFARYLMISMTVIAVIAMAIQGKQLKQEPPEKDSNGIEWYNYEAGWEKAKAENKHMFVDFTAIWCGWCKRLEQNTFSQSPIIESLTKDFVPVKIWEKSTDTLEIDGYRITEQDLRKREFGATSFPQLWFVSPKGARIGPIKGYVDAGRLAHYLEIVKYYHYDSTLDESGDPIEEEKK